MTVTVSIAGLRQELWRKELFEDVRDDLYLSRFMGPSSGSMIQEMTNLKAEKGFKINFGLAVKLDNAGITGDSTIEGSEDQILTYEEEVEISQIRNGVLLTGQMDEKTAAYDMRSNAKSLLADWFAERLERDMLRKLCGDTTTTGHDFANDTDAYDSSHVVYAGGVSAIGDVTSAMKMDCKVLDKAKQTAVLASPKVRPLRVNGKDHYVAILHPYDALNLRQDPVWNQAQREANVRGETNPIFSGSLGMYNGVIVHEHEYVYNYADGSGAATVSRNILCGQQALVLAWGRPVKWVEKLFDYENIFGVSCGAILGCVKPRFNSADYGTITMLCGAAAGSTA